MAEPLNELPAFGGMEPPSIMPVIARLKAGDPDVACDGIKAAVIEKEAAIKEQNAKSAPVDDQASDVLWKIARARVADALEIARVLQGRGAFDVSDIEKSDKIFAILRGE